MKLQFTWGIFPYLVGTSRDRWGHARGPFIWLPHNVTQDLVKHEIFHVKQFYAGLMIFLAFLAGFYTQNLNPEYYLIPAGLYLFWMVSPWGQFRRETAAYGESLRYVEPEHYFLKQDQFVELLTGPHYNFKVHPAKARRTLINRYNDGRLF